MLLRMREEELEEELEEEVCSDSEEVRRRFGSMTFSDYDSAADGDFHPEEEVCSEDSLEYCSETERTVAEDKLGAKEVGLDYTSVAASLAAELVASYRQVQLGLVAGDWLLGAAAAVAPLPAIEAIRRQARAVRRAGEREAGACRMLAERCQ